MTTVKSNINIKIDAEIKEQATQLLERMGLDQATAIDMFFRQIIAEHRLPFQPVVSLTLDEQIIAAALRKKPKQISLTTDLDGNIIITDNEKHPDVYEWAVNG
jgi:DNA-damage-inducible protein J